MVHLFGLSGKLFPRLRVEIKSHHHHQPHHAPAPIVFYNAFVQENDFGGWPEDLSEFPIQSMTEEHKTTLITLSFPSTNVPMPVFDDIDGGHFVQGNVSVSFTTPGKAPQQRGESVFLTQRHWLSHFGKGRYTSHYTKPRGGGCHDRWWWVPRSVVVVVVAAVVAARRILPGMQKRPANKPWRCLANGKKRQKKWVVSKAAAKTLIYNQLHE